LPETLVTISYLVAGILFIFSLGGLSAQESARRGNLFGMIGMALAVGVTAFGPHAASYGVLVGALVVGGSIVIPHLRHAIETLDLARGREE